jgi:hypothetical protein
MRKIVYRSVVVIIFLVATYNSLVAAFGFAVLDSDYSDTVMLWWGFQQYGWPFIKTWIYTQDNWLLSLFPWHALLFYIFSPTKNVLVLSGYFIFLLDVLLCGLIARSLNALKAAVLAPIFLLFSNKFAYLAGYITYPITHNITLFFGLLMLLFAILWLQNLRFWYLALLFIAALIGGISDPWLVPCFCLPLIAAALLLMSVKNVEYLWKASFYLLISLFAALFLIITNCLGLFFFLHIASYSFSNLSRLWMQFFYLFKNIGWFFNFFFIFHLWTSLCSLVLIIILISYIVIRLRKQSDLSPQRRLFFLTWTFSVIFLALSFVLYSYGLRRNVLDYNRYFMNIYFLTLLGICVGAEIFWNTFSKIIKVQYLILALFFVLTGLNNSLYFWKQAPHIRNDEWFENFLEFLQQHQLTYGYANYWQASIITWLSQNQIVIRPIAFNVHNGHIYNDKRVQTSPFWYRQQDIPPSQKLFFVYIEPRIPICPSLELCESGLIEQNGPPVDTVPFKNGMIMVWSHPLNLEANNYEYH